MQRRRLALVALAAAVAVPFVVTHSSQAASPTAGHIGPAHRTLAWTISPQPTVFDGIAVGLEGVFTCPPASQDPADATCDHFTMTVDVPASYWRTRHGSVDITVPTGYYGYVYDAQNRLAAVNADDQGKPRTMSLINPSGTYEVRLAAAGAFGGDQVSARFVSKRGADPGFPISGFSAYHGTELTKLPHSRPQNAPVRYTGQKLAFQATYVGRGAAEPTIGVDKRGRAFYVAAAFDALPQGTPKQEPRTIVLESTDNNRSWKSIQPTLVAGTGDGHPLTMDPYIYVDKDTGRVFNIDLTLGGSYLDYTDDQGKTWTRGVAISAFGANDHQTLFSGPVPKGLPLTTLDAAFPKLVYYCVNQIDGSWCTRSLDGGRTFTNTGAPPFPNADPQAADGVPFCGGLHGHGISDSQGRIFIPRGFCGAPEVAISNDAGTTWQQVRVNADTTIDGGSGDIQTSIAADSADNLYYMWWDAKYHQPYLAISRDHGLHWSRPRMVAPPGVASGDFPSIDAGDPGRIAITFPGTTATDENDVTRPWNTYVVVSTDALSRNPLFLSNVANVGGPKDPVHRGDCLDRCGRMYDFLDVVIAPDAHGTVWATATDTCTSLYSCNTRRIAGFSSSSGEHGASDSRNGVAIRQISGPWLRVPKRR